MISGGTVKDDARFVKSDHMFSNTNRKIHRRKQLTPKVIQIYTQSNSTKNSFHVPLSSSQKSELSVSRDKGQRSRFQNKFYVTLIFTAIKERKIMLMALSKHILEIERQSYTLYKKKSVHMLARKLEFVCLELASFTTNVKQNEKQRKYD